MSFQCYHNEPLGNPLVFLSLNPQVIIAISHFFLGAQNSITVVAINPSRRPQALFQVQPSKAGSSAFASCINIIYIYVWFNFVQLSINPTSIHWSTHLFTYPSIHPLIHLADSFIHLIGLSISGHICLNIGKSSWLHGCWSTWLRF